MNEYTTMPEQVLAINHWKYVESILRTHGEHEEVIIKCKHHYINAFIHGYKHAIELERRLNE